MELALQMPVARFHIPVLVGTPDPDGLGGDPVVVAHRNEIRIKPAFATRTQPVRRRARVVHPQFPRHPTQTLHAFLQPVAEREQGLRLTPRGPLPVRIRQHRVTQQVGVGLIFDRDPQLVGVGPVQLQGLARHPVLRKKHFLVRSMLQPPLLDPPLKRPQMLLPNLPRSVRP